MSGVGHPLFGSHYERDVDGTVKVTEADGRTGWFTWQGRHLRGEVLWADPHVLDWVGGPQAAPTHQRLRAAQHRPLAEVSAGGDPTASAPGGGA
ncbi:MAG: hypothetical protein KGQ66_07575 [Acidobacteriota bacterium]|nr:hypothetical protein [Acidobacteriota bacterium]